MYEAHFGLAENPFGVNPDPRFLFMSEVHQEALAHLIYGVRQRKGFIVITGDVGTGKTTLLNRLLQGLDARTRWAFCSNPKLATDDFLRTIGRGLGLDTEPGGFSKADFLFGLESLLAGCLRKGENVILVVDEAQNLSTDLLEEVRLLSNLETSAEKMLQIILVGQQELNDKLRCDELRQLRQRVSIKYHLEPLGPEDTRRYVLHRLRVAGCAERALFSPEAIDVVYQASGGFPRLINSICDNALLAAYSSDRHLVDAPLVEETVRDIDASYPGGKPAPAAQPSPVASAVPAAAAEASLAAPGCAVPIPAAGAATIAVGRRPLAPDAVGRGWLVAGAVAVLVLALLALVALSYDLWGGPGPLLFRAIH